MTYSQQVQNMCPITKGPKHGQLVDSYFEKNQPLKLSTEEKIQILAQGNVELQEKVEAIDKDWQEFKRDLPRVGV